MGIKHSVLSLFAAANLIALIVLLPASGAAVPKPNVCRCDLTGDGHKETITFTPNKAEDGGEWQYRYSITVKDDTGKELLNIPADAGTPCVIDLDLHSQSWRGIATGDADGDGNTEVIVSISPGDVSPFNFTILRWNKAENKFDCTPSALLIEQEGTDGNFVWCEYQHDSETFIRREKAMGWTTGKPGPDIELMPNKYENLTWIQNIDDITAPGEADVSVMALKDAATVLHGKAHVKATKTGYKVTRWIEPPATSSTPDQEAAAATPKPANETAAKPAAASYLAAYTCVLAAPDRQSSKGAKLSELGEMLAQDRANYHKFNVRQKGDTSDGGYFSTPARRQMLQKLPITTTPGGRDGLNKGLPIGVTVYNDSILVTAPPRN